MPVSKKFVAGAAVALALVTGSAAYAAIPDGGGVIHACYNKTSGALRVTDPATNVPKACTKVEAPLDWNQQGPAAPAPPARNVFIHKSWVGGGFAWSGAGVEVDSFDLPGGGPVVGNGPPGPQVNPSFLLTAHLTVSSKTAQFTWCYMKTNYTPTVDQTGVSLVPYGGSSGEAELVLTGAAIGTHVSLICFGQNMGSGNIVVTATPIDNFTSIY